MEVGGWWDFDLLIESTHEKLCESISEVLAAQLSVAVRTHSRNEFQFAWAVISHHREATEYVCGFAW